VGLCNNGFVPSGWGTMDTHFGWFKTGKGKRHRVCLAASRVHVSDDRKVNASESRSVPKGQ